MSEKIVHLLHFFSDIVKRFLNLLFNGVGKLLIDAITIRDYPMIQGATLVIAVFMIAANLLTDIAVGLADPRIRVSADAE